MSAWYKNISHTERLTFWTCLGGWALDALDVQMFGLVIPALIAAWHLSNADAGLISGVTLVTSALGGWLGGALSDRIGRVRALQVTVLWFSISTFVAAFTQEFWQLLATKALQGFGFGAEWACGAVLMAEIIRPEHRGKVLGTVQSGWAVGWGAAVLLYTAAFSLFSVNVAWRVMFAAGLLPALIILYIRRSVPEPARIAIAGSKPSFLSTLFGVFAPEILRVTMIGGLFGLGAHGGSPGCRLT